MWPIHLGFLRFILCKMFLSSDWNSPSISGTIFQKFKGISDMFLYIEQQLKLYNQSFSYTLLTRWSPEQVEARSNCIENLKFLYRNGCVRVHYLPRVFHTNNYGNKNIYAGKNFPMHAIKARKGSRYVIALILNSAPNSSAWSTSRLSRFTPG